MENLVLNLNSYIKVKLKEKGIEHYVKTHNGLVPFQMHTSYREYKEKGDKDGYHSYQMHEFINMFGGLGLSLSNYVETDIVIPVSSP